MSRLLIRLCPAILLLAACPAVRGGEIYVDNINGDDGFDGSSESPLSQTVGPARTIRRALQRAHAGDRLVIANRGVPYYEAIQVEGARMSGYAGQPFIIEGNGALLSGARRIAARDWEYLKHDLWKFTPVRKGHYLLLRDGAPVQEQSVAHDAPGIPALQAQTWCSWHGSIYYRAEAAPGQSPLDVPFDYAHEQVGISLVDVRDVIIRNLSIQNFRVDGVNAHDRCQAVILDRVQIRDNGRAGLAVGGTSLVGIKDSSVEGNRKAQLIISEKAQLELLQVELKDGAGIPFQIRGGHLLIDGSEVTQPAP